MLLQTSLSSWYQEAPFQFLATHFLMGDTVTSGSIGVNLDSLTLSWKHLFSLVLFIKPVFIACTHNTYSAKIRGYIYIYIYELWVPEKVSIWKTGDLAFLANVRTCTKSPSHKWISRHRKIEFSGAGMEELREVNLCGYCAEERKCRLKLWRSCNGPRWDMKFKMWVLVKLRSKLVRTMASS